MHPLLIEAVTNLIVEFLFLFFPKEFDNPLTKWIFKWAVSNLLKLIFYYVKRKLEEHRSK
ncbi:hypothetical protein D3Z35_14925 [Enterococcus faecalis]|nr:hypothetical protein A4V06_00340 [Enterococcus faecalis]ASU26376.1 hypothetical protein ADH73_10050 [Enterococcus faecalis]NBH39754.1 hypothetical protein [Enterococcus faecalis]